MVSLPPEQMEYYEWLQNEVNNGHQPWRIVPEQVVSDFLINHLNIEVGPKPLAKKVLRNGLEFTLSNEENHLSIFLFQPVTKGISEHGRSPIMSIIQLAKRILWT